MILYTLGYGNMRPDAFDALVPAGAFIIDVREKAWCGHQPAYRRDALGTRFHLRYKHVTELGNHGRQPDCWQPFDENAATVEIFKLVRLLQRGATLLLLCAERDHTHCHRTLVAQAIAQHIPELEIRHL